MADKKETKTFLIVIEDWTGRFVATVEVESANDRYTQETANLVQKAFEDYCEANGLEKDDSAWSWGF